jgi:hypothetical protein
MAAGYAACSRNQLAVVENRVPLGSWQSPDSILVLGFHVDCS